MSGAAPRFRAALAADGAWSALAKSCLDRLEPLPEGANLGFLYVTDALADDLGSILTFLRERTRIADWVGAVGLGICALGGAEPAEVFERPALAVLIAAFPADTFLVFPPVTGELDQFEAETKAWRHRQKPVLGIVHGDPRHAGTMRAVTDLGRRAGLFLVGGLSAARAAPLQVAGRVVEGGLSGVMLSSEISVATGLSQGCAPIGPVRRVTAAQGNVVMTIDGEPALDIFKASIGELLSRDLRRAAGLVFAGFPVAGSDTGDYLVRHLVGIDPEHGWLAFAQDVAPGDPLFFCRRDPASAVADLDRMVAGIKSRAAGSAPRAGLYFSCVARGPNLFSRPAEELGIIRAAFGDFPLVGFFGNGEISNDRLYGYTGVLALFL
ncbi:MAG TPA: FIST C-terminal domain-containing protein [Stellaceae bacterium]|nr:FIST C-terminal domain-containing protein [Stellaceae bacterium]